MFFISHCTLVSGNALRHKLPGEQLACRVPYNTLYDSSNPVHVQRAQEPFVNAMGKRHIPSGFATALIRACRAVFT